MPQAKAQHQSCRFSRFPVFGWMWRVAVFGILIVPIWIGCCLGAEPQAESFSPSNFPQSLESQLLPVAPGVVALAPEAPFGLPVFRTVTERDGLPQNSIQKLAFDPKGYLWVATQDGPAYYNGRSWVRVDLPNRAVSNNVRAMVVASDGSIWFGTDGGGVLQHKNGEWHSFTEASGALPSNQVRCLVETWSISGQSMIWVGTRNGLACLEAGKWTHYTTKSGLPNNWVLSLLETRGVNGNRQLWVGTDGGGLACFEQGEWSVYSVESGALPHNGVLSLLETTASTGTRTLWVGTSGGLTRFENGQWTTFDVKSGLPNNIVLTLLETRSVGGHSTLWIGTYGGGLIRLDEKQAGESAFSIPLSATSQTTLQKSYTVSVYDTRSGLPNNVVYSLLESKSETGIRTLWIGTLGGGLARLEQAKWTAFNTRTGLPNDLVYSLLETKNADGNSIIWAGTDSGLARLERGQWTLFNSGAGLPTNVAYSVLETTSREGTKSLWVGTYGGGLACWENSKWTIYNTTNGLPHNIVRGLHQSVLPGGERYLWVATDAGVARLSLQGAISPSVKAGSLGQRPSWLIFDMQTGLPNSVVRCLTETVAASGERSVWVGTDSGLARLDFQSEIKFTAVTDGPTRPVLSLLSTVSADGSYWLWAGTEGGGVWRCNVARPGSKWESLTKEQNPRMLSNTVNQLREDSQKRLYLFTKKGITRLIPQASRPNQLAEFDCYTFTTDDGLPSNECTRGASLVDSHGRIWAGTLAGVALYDPAQEVNDRRKKPLFIETTLVNNNPVSLEQLTGQSLSYSQNNLVFEYALLSFFRESDTRYQTQLVGYDAAVTDWSATPQRVFTNLPENTYTFRVWGRDYAGNISGPVDVSFQIRPAPWRTWWAYLIYLAGVIGVAWWMMQWQVRSFQRRNEELESKVAARTAELTLTNDELDRKNAEIAKKNAELALNIEQLSLSESRALHSEQEALAAKEEALQASRAKSTFLANMSHELRTPLNAVLGFAQLMERDQKLLAEHRENLAVILRSGEHLLELINDVLSISKIEAGKLSLALEPFDLKLLLKGIREMVQVRAQAKGLRLIFDLDPALPTYVKGDEGKLRQVLINLLGNAVKFTEVGGVALRVQVNGDLLEFEVEDTGQGIAEDELNNLFQPFVQAASGRKSAEGTGLGLAISRTFIQLMGGDIRVRSTPGKGSIFTFELPLPAVKDAIKPTQSRRVRGITFGQPTYRILVVDDVAENRLLLNKLLSPIGFQVREAVNGREACEVWSGWHPHVIWMDLRMPVMNGYAATRFIREAENKLHFDKSPGAETSGGKASTRSLRRPHTVIIALTASAFEHDRKGILEAGCDDFVTKPYREQTIFDKLTEHLGIQFIVEDEAPAYVPPSETALTTERFAQLPPEWIAELNRALTLGDLMGAQSIIDQMSELDPDLADELRQKVKEYQFDEVFHLIERMQV